MDKLQSNLTKFKDFIDIDSGIEDDSKYKVNNKPQLDNTILRTKRQWYRLVIFFIIIFFLFFIVIKSMTDDLTLINMSGLNFFNLCRFP